MTFTATLQLHGKTATGIEVPPTEVEALGTAKRPAVTVTFGGGYSYRTTVAPMGGVFLIPVSKEVRDAAGLHAGDSVEVTLALDTAPRVLEVPDDLAAAIAGSPAAQAFWATLSFSNQKGYVTAVEAAKKPETRTKRVADTVTKLEEGKPR